MKRFNITGSCDPSRHYMVNIDHRLNEIQELVADGNYFVINRARQYGKTTTLRLLQTHLKRDYAVFSLSFEGLGINSFQSETSFCRLLCGLLYDAIRYGEAEGLSDSITDKLRLLGTTTSDTTDFRELSNLFTELCQQASKPVVLIIDEVDQASEQTQFLTFLSVLRNKYLQRQLRPSFQSVILAGVYDIKNMRQKFRPETEHHYNSPWNIATEFNVNMSFSPQDIAGMLEEYECDHHSGMDTNAIAGQLYNYTSGYPFLVSYLCMTLDKDISRMDGFSNLHSVWTSAGLTEAVKLLLKKKITLFDSMTKQLDSFPQMRKTLKDILYRGKTIPYSPDNPSINFGTMFGFLKEKNGTVAIANRIFEMRLYNLFISEEAISSPTYDAALRDKNQFISDGVLNMRLILEKFICHFTDIYGRNPEKFIEEDGRKLFLLYLKPIINGTGNYYVEAQTRDLTKTDVIVDYLGKQYIIELKIWHGNEYNRRGEKQLSEYLDFYHQNVGYMLSFNFNKNKQVGIKELHINGKLLIEATI